jgi:surface protein
LTDGGQEAPIEFTVKTDNAGVSTSTQFRMPLTTSTNLGFTVNWGDGSPLETITNHTLAIHDYGTAGTYTISVTGALLGWQFQNTGDKLKMLDVKQWSGLNISSSNGFYGCANLTATATDAPLITSTSLLQFFRGCINFNGTVNNWVTNSVTNLSGCFDGDGISMIFNQPINSWNTSNVTYISFMFRNASAFNQNIGSWDTSKVISMRWSFIGATNFNNGESDTIKNWNTSNVTDMGGTFVNCINFNQNIGSWDTSKVTTFTFLFGQGILANCDSFNQDLSQWDINQVTNFTGFMLNATGLSTANYDLLLIGWEANLQSLYPSGVGYPYTIGINFGGSACSPAVKAGARQSLIDNFGWTITDATP